jgi:adenylyl cyclase-associated protein
MEIHKASNSGNDEKRDVRYSVNPQYGDQTESSMSSIRSFTKDDDSWSTGKDSWSIGSALSFMRRDKTGKARKFDKKKTIPEEKPSGELERRNLRAVQSGFTQGSTYATSSRRSLDATEKGRARYVAKTEASMLLRDTASVESYRVKRRPIRQLQIAREDPNKPIIEYREKERKWVILNQVKKGMSKNDKIVHTIHVFDSKQKVFISDCHDVSIHLQGYKIKAILIDHCSDLNVIFDTVISSCDVVNCQRIAVQTIGVCPSFAVDKTDDMKVWLTKESMSLSNFVTSKSTGVIVSVPRGDSEDDCDRKEVSLPEQYVHKFHDGDVMSVVPGF